MNINSIYYYDTFYCDDAVVGVVVAVVGAVVVTSFVNVNEGFFLASGL
jgi:hypothetical protein